MNEMIEKNIQALKYLIYKHQKFPYPYLLSAPSSVAYLLQTIQNSISIIEELVKENKKLNNKELNKLADEYQKTQRYDFMNE